mmetsp:Transcript_37574/g.93408  ORF Transcript_37574/g.93408 Transcript_37574/m.93408 type:complete len:214 (+) Transcript_37574:18-659(+)|eukprot:CAMPEP_0113256504 /NCGR_PEP_ID=MMETSP0008_2-20120614/14804_1 /TAXON_ID=97485 /ORGANISM="Prymnesium parvum" /LENGTH=213 /DNA_ID=CAMNT_0000104861 /DNA_START=11 /DNA_END=652 /DNA_ORIENTATION=- /assembly_acc=CAM_ASM_000153
MELSASLARLFREDLIVIEGPALKRPPLCQLAEVTAVIDEMGRRSAAAQGLKGPNGQVVPVTASYKLSTSSERLYLLALGQSPRQVVGIIKMGRKNLFHYDARGTIHQLQSHLSVLDFYVHEAYQRQGVGLALFHAMLEHEETTPEMLAYDRPSPKLIGFLRKHYHLSDFVPQQNNFVIFNRFFEKRAAPKQSAYDSISSRPLTARTNGRRFQ